MKATWRGKVIAESERTLEVDGYRYFPRATVRMDLLRPAPRTPHDLECPHGVRFYDVTDGKQTSVRNAWSYEKPGARMQAIGQWLGFWGDVEVVV